MLTKKLPMSAGLKWFDRGCLATAYLIILYLTVKFHPALPMYPGVEAVVYLALEALGGLIVAALPAWILHAWAKGVAPYHIITLVLAVMMAVGRFYSATH